MIITVLGGGNAAHGLAGDLALKGHTVRLWENPGFAAGIKYLQENGMVIKMTGIIEGEAHLSMVTTDAEAAVKGADIIYCMMPSFGQESAFEHIAPYVEPGQKILIMPGNFGSLSLYAKLKSRGIEKDVLLGEADTIPYAVRLEKDKSCNVWGIKGTVWVSAVPGKNTARLIEEITPGFPIGFTVHRDVFSVALANTNMIIHCPTMIMNAGRIESGERFRFYNDGMTESVCRVMEAMDAERLEVGKAWGYDLMTEFDDAQANYVLPRNDYKNLYEIFSTHPVYGNHGVDSPTAMSSRYLTEDVPFLLVPLYEMGKLAGVPTPTVESVIQMASVINEINYKDTGRGMKALGLGSLSMKEIEDYILG